MKVVVLVDGEHYPPVVRAAIEQMTDEVVGAMFCGGSEKIDLEDLEDAYGVDVVRGEDLLSVLREAIERFRPDSILDCTDEPVLTPDDRFRLASVAIAMGVTYAGADFELRPPAMDDVLSKPSISVFATGKRTGKTAVASALARHASERGHHPVIVAVGRGGPNPPEVIEAGAVLDTETLLGLIEAGKHASSDYIEDALTSGVATIGCVRVGGGLAGATVMSNMADGARMAEERDEDLVILEGSGASIPGVRARVGIIVVPATMDPRSVVRTSTRAGYCWRTLPLLRWRKILQLRTRRSPRSTVRPPNSKLSQSFSGPNPSQTFPAVMCSSARPLRSQPVQ
jgi:cyclic 2,3-diphosphoglycerate synthase